MSQTMAQPSLRRRTDCRVCGSRELALALSLGDTPLANEFVEADQVDKPQDRFPLKVHLCRVCGHAQLLDVVDPQRLFRHYVYVSGTSPVFVEHFRRYAAEVLQWTGMPPGSRVIEIGSNDGTLLRCFKDAGMRVLGIDPAQAIAAEATKRGVDTLPEFFDLALAQRLRREGWEASVVAANNVFAHADDLHGIVEGVAHLLHQDGVLVFEVSYLVDVVDQGLFDTIYHEHLSYHTVKPLTRLFQQHGMELIDAVRVDTHGGSLRGIAQRKGGRWPHHARVEQLIQLETSLGLFGLAAYRDLFTRIQQRKEELMSLLCGLKREGKRIAGFGAPAKATTLMFHFGLGPEVIEYLCDDSPWKQGRFSPGYHLPVVPSTALYEADTRPDDVVILAWNFAEPIMRTHQAFMDGGGHFIVPLPKLEIR